MTTRTGQARWQFSTRALVTATVYVALVMGAARSAWSVGWRALVLAPVTARFTALAPNFPEGHRELLIAMIATVFVAFGVVCLTFLWGWTAQGRGQRPHFTERIFWCTALLYFLSFVALRTIGRQTADPMMAVLLGVLVVTALFAGGMLRKCAGARRRWQPLACMWGFLVAQFVFFATIACLSA
jgi:hypothetical protein